MTLFRTLLFRSPGPWDGPNNYESKPNKLLDVSEFTHKRIISILDIFIFSKTTLKSSKDALNAALKKNDTKSIVSLVKAFEHEQEIYNKSKYLLVESQKTLRRESDNYHNLKSQLEIAKDAVEQWLKISPTNDPKTLWELAQTYEDIWKKYNELSASFKQQQHISKKISLALLDNNLIPKDTKNVWFPGTHISLSSAISSAKKYYRSTLSKYEELFGPEKETISAQDITATWSEKIADILQQTWPKDNETPNL